MNDDIGPLLRTDFKAVDKRDGIHSVMGYVTGDNPKVPIITDGGKPYGILNDRAMIGTRLDPNAHVESYVLTTRALPQTASLGEVAARMAETRAAHIPIEDPRGKLAGYVSAIDVAREQGSDLAARELSVPVTTLTGRQTLSEAKHAFSKEYVDYLPVLNGEGRIAGILPRRAILTMEAGTGHSRGRKDAGGEKVSPMRESLVEGHVQPATIVGQDVAMDKILDLLEDNGHVAVIDRAERFIGIITPETLHRAAGRGA